MVSEAAPVKGLNKWRSRASFSCKERYRQVAEADATEHNVLFLCHGRQRAEAVEWRFER